MARTTANARQPIHDGTVWNAESVGAPETWTCVLDDPTRNAIIDAAAAMRERGVLPSARGPVIRLAPHFYSTIDDVDTALNLLAELTR